MSDTPNASTVIASNRRPMYAPNLHPLIPTALNPEDTPLEFYLDYDGISIPNTKAPRSAH